jgi:tetratricopeptide (TPR) repeat protein
MPGPVDSEAILSKVGHLCPTPVAGIDLDGFHLDPLTLKIVEIVDGTRTIRQIINLLQKPNIEVIKRIKLLRDGGLIQMPVGHSTPNVTLPPQMPVSKPPPPIPEGVRESIMPPEPSETLSDQETKTGSLSNGVAAELVSKAADTGFGGSIQFANGEKRVILHLEAGRTKAVESNQPLYDLGLMLHGKGVITDEGLEAYRKFMAGSPDPVMALRRAGIGDPRVMVKHVSWHARTLFQEVCDWKDGNYMVFPGQLFPDYLTRCATGIGRVGMSSVSKSVKADWKTADLSPEYEKYLAENQARYLAATDKLQQVIENTKLDSKEKIFIEHLVEGCPMQVHRAMTISKLLRTTTRKLLIHVIKSGAFALFATNPKGNTLIPLEELEKRLEAFENENYFGLLNAHAVSTPEEIAARYKQRCGEYDLRRFDKAQPQHIKTLQKIRARFDMAWKILGNTETRRGYRQQTYTQFQLDNFFSLQLQKAETALHTRGDPEAALLVARSAWDLKPTHVVILKIISESLRMLNRPWEIAQYTEEGKESDDGGRSRNTMTMAPPAFNPEPPKKN